MRRASDKVASLARVGSHAAKNEIISFGLAMVFMGLNAKHTSKLLVVDWKRITLESRREIEKLSPGVRMSFFNSGTDTFWLFRESKFSSKRSLWAPLTMTVRPSTTCTLADKSRAKLLCVHWSTSSPVSEAKIDTITVDVSVDTAEKTYKRSPLS